MHQPVLIIDELDDDDGSAAVVLDELGRLLAELEGPMRAGKIETDAVAMMLSPTESGFTFLSFKALMRLAGALSPIRC